MAIKDEKVNNKTEEAKEDLKLNLDDPKIKSLVEKVVAEQLKNQTKGGISTESEVLSKLTTAIEGMREVQQAQLDPMAFENSYVREEDIDPDDVLSDEEVVTFFSHNAGYVIVDTKKNGRPVRAPYGKAIVFKFQAARVKREGRAETINNFSTFRCTSKKILEFLKSHPLYNITFFDRNHRQNLSQNAKFASKVVKIVNKIQGYDMKRLVDSCRNFGIDPSEDRAYMIHELAIKYATEEMKNETQAAKFNYDELEKEVMSAKSIGRKV